jgi:O-antigen/teichoic acid export membrane protein
MLYLQAKFKQMRRSVFVRSIAVVSGGQIGATLISIATAPILSRLYPPESYGALGTYMSYSVVLGTLGNWQYAQAIVIEKWESKARVLSHICFLACLLTSLLAVPLSLWLAFRHEGLMWFLFLPFSTFLGGYAASLTALANRYSLYNRMALIAVLPALISVSLSISLGFLGYGVSGLFVGYLATHFCTFFLCYRMVRQKKTQDAASISWRQIFAVLRRHRRFPLYALPTAFLGSFTQNTPIHALDLLEAKQDAGLYIRANQLLSMPINLIGGAMAQVFQRRAAEEYQVHGTCRPIFNQSLKLLLLVALGPTVGLAFFAPNIFAWFLGPKWVDAGIMARILAPMLFLRLLCSPLSSVFNVAGAQKEDFIMTLTSSVLTISVVWFAIWLHWSPVAIVATFSGCFGLTYLTYLIRSAHHCQRKR